MSLPIQAQTESAWESCTDPELTITVRYRDEYNYEMNDIEVPEQKCVKIIHENNSGRERGFGIKNERGEIVVNTTIITVGSIEIMVLTPEAGKYIFFDTKNWVDTGGINQNSGYFIVGFDDNIREMRYLSCDNPKEEITIAAVSGLRFNVSVIEFPKDTCVTIIFVNEDDEFEHDFDVANIDESSNYIGTKLIDTDYITSEENATITFKTPIVDYEIDFFCSQPGHREANMTGKMIYGLGNTFESRDTDWNLLGGSIPQTFSIFGLLLGGVYLYNNRKSKHY